MTEVFIKLIIPIICILCCIRLGSVSIVKWVKEAYNHEEIFFWGSSFIILGLVFIMQIVDLVYPLGYKGALAIHIWVTITLWFQMYAIISTMDASESFRKKLRFNMWAILFIVITLIIISSNGRYDNDYGIKIFGDYYTDLFFELLYISMTAAILTVLTKIKDLAREYFEIWYAFMLVIVSQAVKILNLAYYDYCNTLLISVENAVFLGAILTLVCAVNKLIKKMNRIRP